MIDHTQLTPTMLESQRGGNLIDYPYELTTRTANPKISKIMLNSVVSTPGANYMFAVINHFSLQYPLMWTGMNK